MTAKPFTMMKRFKKDGKSIYYVRFRLPSGKRSTAKSTSQTSKGAAERWALNYLKKGQIVERENISFEYFSKDFFEWSGNWATDKKVSGKRISKRQCMDKTAILNNRIIPAIGKMRLTEIDKNTIKEFRNKFYHDGLSGASINKALACIKAILEAAEEQHLIQAVPKIERAADNGQSRGILTPEEVQAVFSAPRNDIRAYVANLLAAVTGLRQGEILALKRKSIREGYLDIFRSWNQRTGTLNETTKTGKTRFVPIPRKVEKALMELLELSPWKSPESFIFYSVEQKKPMEGRTATQGLYKMLESIGIDKNERELRRIDFHSWRHFFNSLLINQRVPLQKIQKVTGHLSDEMTAKYYHADDMGDIREIQENILLNESVKDE